MSDETFATSKTWIMIQELRDSARRAQVISMDKVPNRKERLTWELNTALGAIFVVANLEGLDLIVKAEG